MPLEAESAHLEGLLHRVPLSCPAGGQPICPPPMLRRLSRDRVSIASLATLVDEFARACEGNE